MPHRSHSHKEDNHERNTDIRGGSAVNTSYDNSTSGLSTTNVQAAIDRLVRNIKTHDVLLNTTTITATGNKTLTKNVSDYSILLVLISNGTEWKSYYILSEYATQLWDVSWTATDSITWYAICTVTFSGKTMNVVKFTKSGFDTIKLKVYGLFPKA